MKISRDLLAFSERLGHRFSEPRYLINALTHSSIGSSARPDNQRLEFLGDRVLGLIIAQALFDADETAAEGQMAPRYNALVRKETCADIARGLELGAVLKLGRSEQLSGGRRKTALLGDAMEAVIAAVYLDAGFDVARTVVLRHWRARIKTVDIDARDAKTTLQEWAQSRAMAPPAYIDLSRTGPDHAPVFTVEVKLANGACATAKAANKRQAQQAAAAALLSQVAQDE